MFAGVGCLPCRVGRGYPVARTVDALCRNRVAVAALHVCRVRHSPPVHRRTAGPPCGCCVTAEEPVTCGAAASAQGSRARCVGMMSCCRACSTAGHSPSTLLLGKPAGPTDYKVPGSMGTQVESTRASTPSAGEWRVAARVVLCRGARRAAGQTAHADVDKTVPGFGTSPSRASLLRNADNPVRRPMRGVACAAQRVA